MPPTFVPTIYPTYTSSVRVYFMVAHIFSGMSATLYASTSVPSDSVLKETVVSMMGYDSKVSDISIHSITDLSTSSQSQSATETKLVYSVTTHTRVFADINLATTQFIQALNQSIATGAFDTLLHANAAGENITHLLSVTTEYVIFNTASPTSMPSALPAAVDIVDSNLLEMTLTAKAVKAKVQYYLGAFVGYFLSIYLCLYLYAVTGCGRAVSTKFYDTSHQSQVHVKYSAITDNMEINAPILSDILAKNSIVQGALRMEMDLKIVKQASSRKLQILDEEGSKYSKGYREYMNQQRTLLGCSPFLYPNGIIVKVPFASSPVVLPPGRAENIMLFLCHNHPLFSCFYFMDGSSLGAHGTRILYIGKDVSVFVLYQFSNMLLQYGKLEGCGLGIFINLFIITPSAVSVGLLLKYLYTCPFTESVDFQRKYAKYASLVLLLGRLAIIPILMVMCASLFFACLFSSGRHIPMILVNYFLSVQLYGIVLAIIKAILLFVDDYYYRISLFGSLDILCIGRMYKERIVAERLVVDVDYVYRFNKYLSGVMTVEMILKRDDAIKAKRITEVGVLPAECDIELQGTRDSDNDTIMVQNPLVAHRNVTKITIDTIYSAVDDEKGEAFVITNEDSNRDAVTNATDSLPERDTPMPQTVLSTNHQKVLRLERSIINNNAGGGPSVVDDDAALYLEYQQLHSSHDDALYDMSNGDSEGIISFEEWKTRRKQFKQGAYSPILTPFTLLIAYPFIHLQAPAPHSLQLTKHLKTANSLRSNRLSTQQV